MKKIILFFSLLFLVACSNNEVKYDGTLLNIAVVGGIPEIENEKILFEIISLEKLSGDISDVSASFDAIMITPTKFEVASDDQFAEVYKSLEIPTIFFNAEKSHYPFVTEGLTYDTYPFDSLNNGSHTTIYLNDVKENKDDAWFYYLESEKDLDILYTDVFKQIEKLRSYSGKF
ncbi:amino acid oxidase [Alkalihalobacterium elongatum]|uniref:amino acid oxidase n=1 Tax=Alkalihalobacterium elongatum TaxID=2675466 RepID=UPI001F460070|nr:amino acid oxidase [Alkalihalobacterium elongatum]